MDGQEDVESWTKHHGIEIKYKLGKKIRTYIPDILVIYKDGRKSLEEIKGYLWNKMKFSRKNIEALFYCKKNGIRFRLIFKDGLEVP